MSNIQIVNEFAETLIKARRYDIMNESVKITSHDDKYGNGVSNIKFKGKDIHISGKKGDTIDDNYKTAEFLEEDKSLLEKLWSEVIEAVAKEQLDYVNSVIESSNNEAVSNFYKKYQSLEANKKSLNLSSIFYSGRRSNKGNTFALFSLVFNSAVAAKDGHSIFVDTCAINLNTKSLRVYYVTFEC